MRRKYPRMAVVWLVLASPWARGAFAAFPLDFSPHPQGDAGSTAAISCNMPGLPNSGCEHSQTSNPLGYVDATPFYQENVTLGGVTYWHVIVGDPNLGFAQDVYIRSGANQSYMSEGTFLGATGPALSNSGGLPGGMKGGGTMTSMQDCLALAGAGCDPLRNDPVFTGNGSADPTQVAMRQLNNDGALSLEFLKANEANKPFLQQTIDDGEALGIFVADMSTIAYDDATRAGVITNTLELRGTDLPEYARTFDAAAEPGARSTAGRYVYIPAAGWIADDGSALTYYDLFGIVADPTGQPTPVADFPIFQSGDYLYWQGGFDHFAQDVQQLLSAVENPCNGTPFCP